MSESGMNIEVGRLPIGGSQQDDRYVVLFVVEGGGELLVDFQAYTLRPGSVYFVSPGQVVQWQAPGDVTGFSLAFSEDYLKWPGSPFKSVFDLEFFHTVSRTPVLKAGPKAGAFSGQLAAMLGEYQAGKDGDPIVLRSNFKIFMDSLQQLYADALDVSSATREPELVRRFKGLISASAPLLSVSEYADELGVKPGRLKSAIKLSTGMSPDEIVEQHMATAMKRKQV